ncbi:MAG: phosphopantetheine-binding protein, partial [Methanococcaceae archaeon]
EFIERPGEFRSPCNEVERILAEYVEELLGIKQVSVDADFFSLGGHSIIAAQFISRIREKFKIEMEIREIFEHPTIAELAETIQKAIEQPEYENEIIEALPRSKENLSDLVSSLNSDSNAIKL